MVILNYVGLDIGGGKNNKTVYAVISDTDTGNGPVLIDVNPLGLDDVPNLVRTFNPQLVVIDAPLSWNLDRNTGMRHADDWLKEKVPDSIRSSVMSTNSMQAVPVRGLHFAIEFELFEVLVAETHPTISLYHLLISLKFTPLTAENLTNAYKDSKSPNSLIFLSHLLNMQFLSGSFSTTLQKKGFTLTDDFLDATICALLCYYFNQQDPLYPVLTFNTSPHLAVNRSFGNLHIF